MKKRRNTNCEFEVLRAKLEQLAQDNPTASTKNPYYDESYPGFIEAGCALRRTSPSFGRNAEEPALQLAHMIAGWNTGELRYVYAESLIEAVRLPCDSLVDIVQKCSSLENEIPVDTQRKTEEIREALDLAQNILGVDSVSIPSKFLHFLSPRIFAPLDANVCEEMFSTRTVSKHYYECYHLTLWNFGFTSWVAPDEEFQVFWGFDDVTPLRVVDCSAFSRRFLDS